MSAVKVATFVGVVIVIFALYFSCDAQLKDECRERGGQVEPVYGGRPGWICEGDR